MTERSILKLIRNPLFLSGIALSFLFTLAMLYWGQNVMSQVLTYVLNWVAPAVGLAFLPFAIRRMAEGKTDRTAHMLNGVTLSWLAFGMASNWAALAYLTGWDWVRTSPVIATYIFFSVLGAIEHMLAIPDMHGRSGRVSRWSLAVLIASLIIGFTIGILTVVFNLEKGLSPAAL